MYTNIESRINHILSWCKHNENIVKRGSFSLWENIGLCFILKNGNQSNHNQATMFGCCGLVRRLVETFRNYQHQHTFSKSRGNNDILQISLAFCRNLLIGCTLEAIDSRGMSPRRDKADNGDWAPTPGRCRRYLGPRIFKSRVTRAVGERAFCAHEALSVDGLRE